MKGSEDNKVGVNGINAAYNCFSNQLNLPPIGFNCKSISCFLLSNAYKTARISKPWRAQ